MLRFKFFIILLISFCLINCTNRTINESNEQFNRTLQLMTSTEKILYDSVEAYWGHTDLESIRREVYKRLNRPTEESVPFLDIANIIITTENFILTDARASNKNNPTACKRTSFKKLDSNWFQKLQYKIDNKTGPQFVSEKLEEEAPAAKFDFPEGKQTVSSTIKLTQPVMTIEQLKRKLRKCETASELFRKIVKRKSILDTNDYNLLNAEILKCETKRLAESFED